MKLFNACLMSVILLSGCSQRSPKKKVTRTDRNANSEQQFIIPSTELSAQSLSKDSCASLFVTPHKIITLSKKEKHRQLEAKFFDIPTSLMINLLSISSDRFSKHSMLKYSSSLSRDNIKKFYIEEMDRLGWNQQYLFDGDEILIGFKMPGKFCTLIIRPVKKTWERSKKIFVTIFVIQ